MCQQQLIANPKPLHSSTLMFNPHVSEGDGKSTYVIPLIIIFAVLIAVKTWFEHHLIGLTVITYFAAQFIMLMIYFTLDYHLTKNGEKNEKE